jgi:hypothetical protein
MIVIMLRGPSSCGKTTTLNLVYTELIKAGATITTARTPLEGNPMDFEAELAYINKAKINKKVAIYSQGDFSCWVIDAMKRYAIIGVDVLVIACNDRFIRPGKQMAQYHGSLSIQKTKNPYAARTLDDVKLANRIISMI